MTIAVGDKLPDATFKVRTPEGLKDVTTAELTQGKKLVLFAVPGAFTPTCHAKHLPSYVEHFDALKAKGVDTVACVAVNDAFVLDAWGKSGNPDGKISCCPTATPPSPRPSASTSTAPASASARAASATRCWSRMAWSRRSTSRRALA